MSLLDAESYLPQFLFPFLQCLMLNYVQCMMNCIQLAELNFIF